MKPEDKSTGMMVLLMGMGPLAVLALLLMFSVFDRQAPLMVVLDTNICKAYPGAPVTVCKNGRVLFSESLSESAKAAAFLRAMDIIEDGECRPTRAGRVRTRFLQGYDVLEVCSEDGTWKPRSASSYSESGPVQWKARPAPVRPVR